MPTGIVLRRIAIGCAIVLLCGPLGGRTTWEKGHVTATDAAGYNVVALLSGVVALTALGVAFWTRPRFVLPVLGALVAVAAFGLTAYVSGIDVLARTRGEVYLYGVGEFMRVTAKVNPAIAPPFFAFAAVVGAVSAFALAVSWIRQRTSEERRAR